jgi:hypothetical protein
LTVFLQFAIIRQLQENPNKGEMKMENGKSSASSIEYKNDTSSTLKPRTIKNLLVDWKDGLEKIGQVAVWPSWAYGQYIKETNTKAQANKAKLASRKFADIREKVILRHGKLVRILHNSKTGARIPTKGMNVHTKNQIDIRNRDAARQIKYFGENNALKAITAMMGMPRRLRRMLASKLGMAWGTTGGYREAEAMIREM